MRSRTIEAPAGLALALVAILSLAACGGGGSGGDGGNGDATSPTATLAGEEPTTAPAAGGGGGDVPTIADGVYMAGTAHIEVSGDKSLTVDAPLVPGASITTNGATLLYYVVGEGEDAVSLNVFVTSDSGPGINLTSAAIITAGGPDEGCRFEFSRNDGSGITGTFTCSDLVGLSPGGLEQPTVDVKGTFSADL